MNGRKKFLLINLKINFIGFYSSELVQVMRSIGNKLANSIWEANIKNRVKPQPNASSYVFSLIID